MLSQQVEQDHPSTTRAATPPAAHQPVCAARSRRRAEGAMCSPVLYVPRASNEGVQMLDVARSREPRAPMPNGHVSSYSTGPCALPIVVIIHDFYSSH